MLKLIERFRHFMRCFEPSSVEDDSANTYDEEADVDPFDPFPTPVRLEIRDVIDLHTFQPRDVRRVIEEYLREAYAANFRSVRIIHGKGKGVQRAAVREILSRAEFVRECKDAPPSAGGLERFSYQFCAYPQ